MDKLTYPSLIPQEELEIHEHEYWSGLWTNDICLSIEKDMLQVQREWDKFKLAVPGIYPEIKYVYKYRTYDVRHPERTSEIFSGRKLWAASLHSLNDPMEGGFQRPYDSVESKASFTFVYMMRSQWCGCISFSIDPVSNTMWSHYGADHTGFCIRYRRLDSALLSSPNFRPVHYRASMPQLNLNDPNRLLQLVDSVFWTKSEEWESESEWRLRYPRIDNYTYPGLLVPDGVIFGLRTKPVVRNFLRECATNLSFGEIETIGDDYRLRVVWGKDNSEKDNTGVQYEQPKLNEGCEKVFDLSLEVTRMQIEKIGEIDPFGVVVYNNKAEVLISIDDESVKHGIAANQLLRRVEDRIRKIREIHDLQFAAIIYDADIRPIEGGPVKSVITGRIEEKNGLSFQFFQEYDITAGRLNLGARTIISRKHHLIP